ncbi:hypothetical protein BC832DRAFT_412720 [Gaertneriomyces semiglobifer]|nr:hypothetical protein BC832DRAFT_412720 [Gaertneriomyces semiglobifer]
MPSRVRAGRGGKRNRTPISEVVHILWNQQKLAQGQDRVAEAAEAQHESTAPTDDIETAPASFLGIPELDMPSPFFTFSTARLENLKFALPELNESAVQIGSSGPASPSSQSTLSPASSATDSSSMETPLTCSCDGHPGRLLLDTVYSADGNEVAAAIFGEGGSDVFEDVAVKRGCTDMEIDLWTRDEGGRWDTRVVSYKLYVKGSLCGFSHFRRARTATNSFTRWTDAHGLHRKAACNPA